MTRDEFDQLVSALEVKYRDRHAALARRAVVFAALGYAGLALSLLLGAVLCVAMVAFMISRPGYVSIKLGLVIGVPAALVTWAVLKGLWVRLDAPEGVSLSREDAPALFAVIDGISREAGGVKFHEVLLTGDLNAAVVQVPRLGVFGWYKTYLLLGLPLMDAMEPDEFKAVVAHEFAHLSNQDGRLGSWLYRLRSSWERVMDSLSEQGAPRPLLAFINWFWPRFNASAFVLSRSQEYQADAFAALVTSPQASARGLQRLAVETRRLDDHFWENIGKEMNQSPDPPVDVFHRMQAFLSTEPERGLATRWLAGALAMRTDTADTHPGLTDRLEALGMHVGTENLPPLPQTRASDEWLEPTLAHRARDRFSKMWCDGVGPHWQEAHRERQELRQQLDAPAPATPEETWERLVLRARLEGPDAIQGDLAEYLKEHPDHPVANYFRGRHLAEQDDLAAAPYLEKAAEQPDLFHEALGALAGLYDRSGRGDQIAELKRRADCHDAMMEQAVRERNTVIRSDRFLPPDLTAEEIAKVVAALRKHKVIRAAWLVRKSVTHFPEWRTYVLVIDARWPFYRPVSSETTGKLLHAVLDDLGIDGAFLALLRNSRPKRVVKAITKVEGASLPLASA